MALSASNVSAQAIWKWRDRDGHLQVSDRAPPVDVPDKDILQRPGAARGVTVSASAPLDAGTDALIPAPGASAPSTDRELEARKRKLLADQAAQKQAKESADKERTASVKAENCRRARNQLKTLESGVRISRPNEQGEREVLDDQGREQETQRARDLVNSNCN